ncbi:MAG: glycosyltransferase family 4 protein [bacterium]
MRDSKDHFAIALFDNLPSGGGKRAVYDFAKSLHRLGHRMDLYTLSTAALDYLPLDDFMEKKKVYDFAPGRHRFFYIENAYLKARDLGRLDSLCRRIAGDINSGGYDLAFLQHCHIARSPMVLPYLRMPGVYYCQEPSRRFYEPPFPGKAPASGGLKEGAKKLAWNMHYKKMKRLEERVVRHADVLLCNSRFSREAIRRAYGIEARVCYLSVDPDHFRPLGLPREDMLLTVGRLDVRKGHSFLIESLAKVKGIDRMRLVIIADSGCQETAESLARMAEEKGVNLEILQGIDEALLLQFYNRAKLLVYAPVLEPFGLVPLEAMACGTPVVGVREGGVRESVVDGETGLLTDRVTDEFAAAVTRLLNSPEECARLGSQGRRHVMENWSPQKSARELLSHFRHAVSAGDGAGHSEE